MPQTRQETPPHRRSPAGFTMIELLFVVTLILSLSFIAFPSLKTFTSRDQDSSLATFISHEFNRVKAQSQMRNRPYVVRFLDFNAAIPRGQFEIYESNNTSCVDAITDLNANARRLSRYGFGGTPVAGQAGWTDPPGGTDPGVGLTGWVDVGGNLGNRLNTPLTLCVRPDGSVHTLAANVSAPLAGRIAVVLQKFRTVGAVEIDGPPRIIRIDFTQTARLELN